MIRHLRQTQIDRERWDNCVASSESERLYGYSWFLDHVAGRWDGLVVGEYEAVFPLPWRRSKYGLKVARQPVFCQQLGLFSPQAGELSLERVIQATPRSFLLGQLYTHGRFAPEGSAAGHRTNQVLSLADDYPSIVAQKYLENHRRSLKKARKHGLRIEFTADHSPALRYSEALYTGKELGPQPAHYDRLHRALASPHNPFPRESVCCHAPGGELLGSLLLAHSWSRVFILMGGCGDAGKKLCGNHLLYDAVIARYAGTGKLLDFEGSDLPAVNFFNKCFGATNETYHRVQFSPWPGLLAVASGIAEEGLSGLVKGWLAGCRRRLRCGPSFFP
ncbi:MAG: GNAT family N-acetyltransferase [Limisphaerales bacterium]